MTSCKNGYMQNATLAGCHSDPSAATTRRSIPPAEYQRRFPLSRTHIFTVLSRPPLTTLSATKSTQYTSSVWPGRSILILYVRRSHNYDRRTQVSSTTFVLAVLTDPNRAAQTHFERRVLAR
jgi:hypothetical protein